MFLHSYFIHNNMNPLFGDDGKKKQPYTIYVICKFISAHPRKSSKVPKQFGKKGKKNQVEIM
jgi:hypothetical protein